MSERRSVPLSNIFDVDKVRMDLARNLVAARTALEISQGYPGYQRVCFPGNGDSDRRRRRRSQAFHAS